MAEFRLIDEILARSQSKIWDAAKLEWDLHDIILSEIAETCLCGHYPIKELCEIRNRINGGAAIVGNCCVKKFMGLPSDLIFQAIKRVREDTEKSLNQESIAYAFAKGWITQWDRNFYVDIMRKRKLSEKQARQKARINQTFLDRLRQSTK